jgi:hypothetical protein
LDGLECCPSHLQTASNVPLPLSCLLLRLFLLLMPLLLLLPLMLLPLLLLPLLLPLLLLPVLLLLRLPRLLRLALLLRQQVQHGVAGPPHRLILYACGAPPPRRLHHLAT